MYQINKTDTQLLKGIGILMIVFHNYLHFLPPYIGENEFNFDSNRFSRFWEAIIISPSSTWSHVLSFLGHYGISIFIFLSAYGLYLSQEKHNYGIKDFFVKRVYKLYPAFIIVLVLFLIYAYFNNHPIGIGLLMKLGVKVLAISNLIPNEFLSVNGPWWFFTMIVQFYIFFPILFTLSKKWKHFNVSLLVFGLLLLYLSSYYDILIKSSFLGFLPDIAIAFTIAQRKSIPIVISKPIILLILLCTIILSQHFWFLWPLSSPVFALFCVGLYSYWPKRISSILSKSILFYGAISYYLFLSHGFIRESFITYDLNNLWYGRILLLSVYLLSATLLSLIVSQGEKLIYHTIKKVSPKQIMSTND